MYSLGYRSCDRGIVLPQHSVSFSIISPWFGFHEVSERGKTEVCSGPWLPSCCQGIWSLVYKSPPNFSTGPLGMAQETTFSQNKFSISTLGLLQESCEMHLKELRKIQIGRHLWRSLFQPSVPSMADHKARSGYLWWWRSHHLSGPHPRTAPRTACAMISSLLSQKFSWIESYLGCCLISAIKQWRGTSLHWLSKALVSHQGHSWRSLLSTRIAALLARPRASFPAGLLAAMGRTHPFLRLCPRRFMAPHFCSLSRPLWRAVFPSSCSHSVEQYPVPYIPSSVLLIKMLKILAWY